MTARTTARWSPWLAFVGVAAWLGFSLGLRHLTLPDEGRYAGVAWEMIRSGDWLLPTLDGLPFFHKPPLFYWITSASLSVFGIHAWAARIAPWLGALLAAMALFLLLRRWSTSRVAGWALVILVTQPLFFGGAQFANLDMLVAGCITATITLLADSVLRLESGQPGQRTTLLAAYAMAALGVLAKGLIGVVLPLGIVVVWLVLARRRRHIRRLISWPGALVFIAIATPWFIAMQQRFDGFAHYFFVYQHFQRYALGGFNNAQPLWFFVVALALCTLPWFPGLWAARRNAADPGDGPVRLLRLLMWVWLIGVVVFFSLPRSKLVGYVLPAAPPLAALIADGIWRRTLDGARTERRLRGVAALAAVTCLAVLFTFKFRDTRTTEGLASVLASEHKPGEPVFFVGEYYYDLPLLARLREPVQVVEAWNAVDVAQRDNWRKELRDAARFAQPAADAVLVDRTTFPKRVCERPVSWVVAPSDAGLRHATLAALQPIALSDRTALWRIDARACAGATALPLAY